MKHSSPLFFIVYDSITNSVFDGQVLQPLIKHHAAHRLVTIISYEKTPPRQDLIELIAQAHQNIRLIIIAQGSPAEKILPKKTVTALKNILMHHPHYEVIARGPYAGRIALMAYNKKNKLTVQARGLLAQEYKIEHEQQWSIKNRFIFYLLRTIERTTYQKAAQYTAIIEAVSPAMKDYLISTYQLTQECFTIANKDIPEPLPFTDRHIWRQAIRTELAIDDETIVYCYNGSIKPWQCPQETIAFFKEKLNTTPPVFLLVITQDTDQFSELLKKNEIPTHLYKVICLPHHLIYQYLAASDRGIVLREPHIVNWVSRPTKILEYQSAGLTIVHNNTIALLCNEHTPAAPKNPHWCNIT